MRTRVNPLSGHALSVPDNLNIFLSDGRVFLVKKHDWATTAGTIDGNVLGHSGVLWVKRFNSRGVLDFVLKKVTGSRARRLYRINLRLHEKGFPVSKPLAYIDTSFKEKNSFCISTVIEHSGNLSELHSQGLLLPNRKLTHRLAETIVLWHARGAVHGDLKWPNILVQAYEEDYKIFLVDLDQARLYEAPSLPGITKDLKRFYRFGLEIGADKWVAEEFFHEYMACAPVRIKAKIDLTEVIDDAHKEWVKKGQKRY